MCQVVSYMQTISSNLWYSLHEAEITLSWWLSTRALELEALVHILTLSLTSCLTLSNLVNLSMPQFSNLENVNTIGT